jgi:L-rhamnose mutarotase
MTRVAFTMQLHSGKQEEYRRRHDALWPDLAQLLNESGIHSYSIFLDKDSGKLFAFLHIEDPDGMASLRNHPVMRKWWDYMKDIMDTHPDGEPVSTPLQEVFYLP